MSNITELREAALKLVKEAQVDLNRKDLDASVEAQADVKLDEARKLEERARKLEEASEIETRMNAVDLSKRPTSETRTIETSEVKKSHSDEFRGWLRTGQVGQSMEYRAGQTEGTFSSGSFSGATAGGYTVPVDLYNALTVSLIKYSPLGDPNITNVLETSHGNPLQFPTLNDTASFGSIIGEAVAVNTSNAFVFGQTTLTAYTFVNDIVLLSAELLADTGVNLEQTLIDQVSQRIGRRMAKAFTVGTGTGEPTGIVTAVLAQSGANTTTVANTAVSFDDLYTVWHSTEPAYRSNPKFFWEMNDNTLMNIRKLKDTNGRYLLDATYAGSDLQGANPPPQIFGTPIITNQAMANVGASNTPILVGDHAGFMVRKTGSIQMQRLVERYAEFRQVGYMAFVRADSNLLDPRALRALVVHA